MTDYLSTFDRRRPPSHNNQNKRLQQSKSPDKGKEVTNSNNAFNNGKYIGCSVMEDAPSSNSNQDWGGSMFAAKRYVQLCTIHVPALTAFAKMSIVNNTS